MKKGLVSVIIPLYKSELFIRETLQSVLDQTYPQFEILCIDDGSPDKTAEVVQEIAQQDSRIRYHRHPKNMGSPAFGRNTGLDLAEGEFVSFLDHDDTFLPNKLAELHKVIEREEVDFVCSNIYLLNNGSGQIDGTAWGMISGNPKKYFGKRLLQGNFVPPNSTLIRRAVFEKVGFFDTKLRGADDFDMWYRIVRAFPSTVYNQPLATWRYLNNQSISSNEELMMQDEMAFYQKILDQPEWSQAEKVLAERGVQRNQRFLANRILLRKKYAEASRLYQEAGLTKIAQAVRLAGPLVYLAYSLKTQRNADKKFRPLELTFTA